MAIERNKNYIFPIMPNGGMDSPEELWLREIAGGYRAGYYPTGCFEALDVDRYPPGYFDYKDDRNRYTRTGVVYPDPDVPAHFLKLVFDYVTSVYLSTRKYRVDNKEIAKNKTQPAMRFLIGAISDLSPQTVDSNRQLSLKHNAVEDAICGGSDFSISFHEIVDPIIRVIVAYPYRVWEITACGGSMSLKDFGDYRIIKYHEELDARNEAERQLVEGS